MEGEWTYIYGLSANDGEIRYAGKASAPAKRLAGHMRDSHRRHTPLYSWIRKLTAVGQAPTFVILREVPAAEWKAAEKEEIARYRVSGRLLNLADGGDQPFCPPDVRARNGRQNAIKRDPRMWSDVFGTFQQYL